MKITMYPIGNMRFSAIMAGFQQIPADFRAPAPGVPNPGLGHAVSCGIEASDDKISSWFQPYLACGAGRRMTRKGPNP